MNFGPTLGGRTLWMSFLIDTSSPLAPFSQAVVSQFERKPAYHAMCLSLGQEIDKIKVNLISTVVQRSLTR